MMDLKPRIDLEDLPVWERIRPISLKEMDGVKLMNRIDTKFVTSESVLVGILDDAADAGYRVCTIDGQKIHSYTSLYFDTPDLSMYTAHHNGRKVRQKVRTRTYDISGDTFLEIKRKNNKGRTKKKRISIPQSDFGDFKANEEACRYLAGHSWFTAEGLVPRCTTEFRRITLVNPSMTERLTIDTQVCFRNFMNGNSSSLKSAVIIELKQDGRVDSQMRSILLQRRVKPFRVSKYCMGNIATDPLIKGNRFKAKMRYIEKTINDTII